VALAGPIDPDLADESLHRGARRLGLGSAHYGRQVAEPIDERAPNFEIAVAEVLQ
jgi:hypothetical protein